MIDEDPVTQLLDQVAEWEDLEDPKPPNFPEFQATLAAVEHLHGPGSCVPCWKARRGMNPLWNLVLVLVLAAALEVLVPSLPGTLRTHAQDVFVLSILFLLLSAFLTFLLSSVRRREVERHEEDDQAKSG